MQPTFQNPQDGQKMRYKINNLQSATKDRVAAAPTDTAQLRSKHEIFIFNEQLYGRQKTVSKGN
jgi:hypothetical protein